MNYFSLFFRVAGFIYLYAASPAHASGTAGTVYLTDISVAGDGVVTLTAPGLLNPDSCESSTFLVLPSTLTNQAYYLSIALTAKATGRQVYFWVNGCQLAGSETRPKVWQIMIK